MISNFQKIAEYQKILTTQINPNLERINAPLRELSKRLSSHLTRAMKLNKALKRIHLTLGSCLRHKFSFYYSTNRRIDKCSEREGFSKVGKLHIQINQM